jgi:hypothetical protein
MATEIEKRVKALVASKKLENAAKKEAATKAYNDALAAYELAGEALLNQPVISKTEYDAWKATKPKKRAPKAQA